MSVRAERLVIEKTAVVWFSAGAASAVALWLASKEYKNFTAVYCDTGGEHPDNKRFLKDVEQWVGVKIKILKNERYADHFDVFEKDKFIVSPMGARCTLVLKRKLREEYQKPSMTHIFGYTLEEKMRAVKFEMRNKGLKTDWILIRNGVSKENCLGLIEKAGITLPEMYKLGYGHNNCIGCVKGGMGYWNKIRVDFPEQFKRMAEIERKLDISINRDKDGKVFLDELEKTRGNFTEEADITCDIFCHDIASRFAL